VRNVTTNNQFPLRLGTKWPLNGPEDTRAIWWTSFQPLIHSHLLTAIRFLFQMTERSRNGWIACFAFETARSSSIEFDMPFGFH
jgi:hypothetical protein